MKNRLRFFTGMGISFFILLLLITGLILPGCSSDTGEGSEPEAVTDTISAVNGGVHKVGQAEVTFPAGSVNSDVEVTGKLVNLPQYPDNLKPVSSVHRISISKPEAYNEYAASISFKIDGDMKNVSIYHSSDGVNWESIGSKVSGNTVSTYIPGFSYFMAAAPTEDSADNYSVTIYNKCSSVMSFCLYQTPENQPDAYSLSWLVVNIAPSSSATLNWNNTYSFCFGEGFYNWGWIFNSSQDYNADPFGINSILLTGGSNGNLHFVSPDSSAQAGTLCIKTDQSTPSNQTYVGYSCSGQPVMIQSAAPNTSTVFTPGNNTFCMTASRNQQNQGELLHTDSISYPAILPINISSVLYVSYYPYGTWSISVNPPE